MTAPTPAEPAFAPAPGQTPEVEYAVAHRIGRVRLNRPRAINALTTAMCTSLWAQLRAWTEDDAVAAVFIEGAGDKGLCAGGDVREMRELIQAGKHEEVLGFWHQEYVVNGLIADYPKPYVAWMDGVVMGGGVGISAHGSRRLVTERSKIAMPETVIGFFPDVGGLYYLAKAPGELGTHVALTGLPVSGADAVVLGLADEVVSSGDKEQVLADLAAEFGNGPGTRSVTSEADAATASGAADAARVSDLEQQRGWIDECYAGDDAAVILQRLQSHDDPAAREAGEVLTSRSPHSVVVSLEAIRRARELSVHQVLDQDGRLGGHFGSHPDFAEGVRALLVDKDNNPQWADASVAVVDRARVLAAFES